MMGGKITQKGNDAQGKQIRNSRQERLIVALHAEDGELILVHARSEDVFVTNALELPYYQSG